MWVNYIVENTVGKLTAGKTPEQVSKLTIVDPACGSGSFLLGAYDYLLKWHLEYYKPQFNELSEKAANGNLYNTKQRQDFIKQRNKLPLTPEGHLTTALKKQILLNNIYGVDIDTQAVEVTKLSLLLINNVWKAKPAAALMQRCVLAKGYCQHSTTTLKAATA